MTRSRLALAAFIVVAIAGSAPASAQGGSSAGGATAADGTARSKPARAARSKREPTMGQMAARDRQRKCGAEWKEAKAGNKTGGLKWPQFWSRCNARLKGNQA